MALSGTFTNNYSGWTYSIEWAASQSIADNTSTVVCTHKLVMSNGYSVSIGSRSNSCTLGGDAKTFTSPSISAKSTTVTLGSTTHTVKHNGNGEASFSCTGVFNIQATLAGTYVSSITTTGSATLNTIPRKATVVSAPNFNDEENPTITYNNPAGNSVTGVYACISFTGSNADVPYRQISATGTSYTFELTDAERNILRNGTTDANSRTVLFYVRTDIGGNSYYSSLAKTLTIKDGTPTLSPVVKDQGTISKTLTGNTDVIIKGYNTINVSSGAVARKGASIVSQSVVCGGKSLSGGNGLLDGVESGTFVFSVTDSRGNTVTKTVNKTLIEYVQLTCNFSIGTPTTDGVAAVNISGNYWSGNFGATNNTLTVQYRYKANSGAYGSWVNASATTSGTTYNVNINVTGLDYQSSYTFQARAVDKIYTIETPEQTVKTLPVFDWGENDINFNVPIHMNGNQVIRATDTNRIVVSAEGADIYLRPNGTSVDAGQLRLMTDGRIALSGSVMNDFVIEQGTSGIWIYRKWNSGIAECWGMGQHTAASSDFVSFQTNYPFAFTAIPIVTVSGGANGGWIKDRAPYLNTSSTTGIAITYRNASSNSILSDLHIHVIGKWK